MKEYTKIETIFERDMEGSKKLIEGKFRNETVEFLKDNQWICTEKIDGCLLSKTKLLQTNGEEITIGNIVKNKIPAEIYGYENGKIVPTKVIGWHYNGETTDWLYIRVNRRYNGNKGNAFQSIWCTPNHKFYVDGRYVCANELKVGDYITYIHDERELSFLQEQILTGLILGDGCYSKTSKSIEFSHKIDKEEYINWLLNALGSLAGNKQKVKTSGYGSQIIPARTISCEEIKGFAKYFFNESQKYIANNIKLSPVSLAILYMDDGSLQSNGEQLDRGTIALNDFDEKSVDNFIKALKNQLNLNAVKFYSKGWNVRFNYCEFKKLQLLISPYICQCMQYKLSDEYKGRFVGNIGNELKDKINVIVKQKILSIEKKKEIHKKYDITTETHNYFANGILVHNCNIGIVWDGHKVSYQGRTERAQIPAHLMNKLIEMFGGEINEELFEQKFGEMQVILFGEGYGAKIQKGGGNYRSDVSFILFDVYLPKQDLWLKRDALENIAKTFNIDVVPIVLTGTLQEAVNYVKQKPKSTIGVADMEGLVCKPVIDMLDRMGRRIVVKIKVIDFN